MCHASRVLELRDIAKAYGDHRALDGVTLDVQAGEAVLLVGRNGAGKTTLLRIATGFLDPDAGRATIAGIDVATERQRAQGKLGYLPEHAPAPAEITVRAHLASRARLKGLRGAAARDAIDKAMTAAAVSSEANRRIGTLSKGFRQRVGLADALLGDPALLVLDEPTSGMDPIQTKELREHLVTAARDRAVLVSSHAVAELEGLAARIAVLRDGKLVANASPAELLAQTKTSKLEDAVVALLGEPSAKEAAS
jgi:ABC-2 type transport system ATP-binding protein